MIMIMMMILMVMTITMMIMIVIWQTLPERPTIQHLGLLFAQFCVVTQGVLLYTIYIGEKALSYSSD